MKNKFFIFIVLMIFIAFANFAFAVDENSTQIASDSDNVELAIDENDNIESVDNSPEILENSVEVDNIAKKDNSNLVADNIKTIVMGKVTKRYNGVIQYSASFFDVNGDPLKDTKVMFEVDDYNDYQPVTDSNGVALLTILITNGNHKIAARNPATGEIDSANIKVFDVVTGGKNINMYYDDGNTYKVRVFDDNGNPVKAGQKVTFKIGSKKYIKTTNKNGYASLKIPALPGNYFIYASYKDFTIGNNLKVKGVLKAKTGKIKNGLKFKLQVKFLGKNKKNKLIKVKFNKKTYKAKTNKKGIAIFNLNTPKKLGAYKVVISYKKSNVYYTYTHYYTKA